MSFSPDGRPLNKCTGCGCYVDLGVERCPNCRREIINRHTFWYKYQEHILRGLAGVGVGFRFNSMSPFSGVHDPKLDQLLTKAQGFVNTSQRCGFYNQASQYIAKNYYGPFYFTPNPTNLSAKGIGGPGLTTSLPAVALAPTIPWESVYYNPGS